ncbi:MAG TPA: hypothetical protein VMM92_05325, partial [Thermoanaerobaculia bacterium]|nr:hypothetical protein [Thermoanaerobaculia bacterium]
RLPAPRVFRRRLAAILTVVAMLYLYRIEKFDHPPGTVALETAAGTLRLPARQATAIAQALGYLERNAHDGETLTAFPESGFFNFVLGLRSPLQQDLIIPGVLHGSREVAAARQVGTAGPRFVLLCNRPTPEYGQIAFGRDYATGLWREVTARYVLAESFGGARGTLPVGAGPFFIRLYERSPEAPASAQLPSSGLRHRPTPGADSLLSQLLR